MCLLILIGIVVISLESGLVLGQTPPAANPFAPKNGAPPLSPKADLRNPFEPPPKPAEEPQAPNPFAPKPKPAMQEPKPEPQKPEPMEVVAPVELLAGSEWKVQPDPSPLPIVAVTPAAIPAPGPAASNDLRRERTRYRVLTPNVPGNVVGLGLNEKEGDSRAIWDLEGNRQLGTIKGLALEGSRLMAISPDGLLFAAKPQFDDFVVVMDVLTGKKVKQIPLAGLRLDLLAFSTSKQLLLGEDGKVVVLTALEGRREREVAIERWSVRDGWTISPGGRYLAVLTRESAGRNLVKFVDLTTGETAGTCRVCSDQQDTLGIAISRDGTRLASIVDRGDGATVSQIDLKTPSRLADIPVSGGDLLADEGYQGPVLEWLPDGRHLMIAGRLVVDTELSEVARTLPPPPPSPLVLVGPTVTLSFDGRELKDLPLGLSIDPSLLEKLKPMESVTPAAPLTGPGVITADRSKATEKTVGPAGHWDVRLTAPPSVPDRLDTNGFKVPGGYLYQALLAPGVPPVAVVSYAAKPLSESSSPETATWAEVFDLQSGESRNRVEFTFPTVAQSLSPGGRLMATMSQDGAGRVDVWSLDDDRHLGGFQPAGYRADRQTPWMVEFIDEDHLLIAVANELSLWEFPSCRAIYSLAIGPIRPVLSPSRDHVIVSSPDEPRAVVIECLTGIARGSIAASKLKGDRLLSAAFHHRGRWAAVLSGGVSGGELAVVETDSGRETARIRIPISSDVLQFCDDDHLLLGGRSLVSLSRERIVWTYDLPTGMHLRDTLGGFHWYIAGINPTDRVFVMHGSQLPEDLARKEIAAAQAGSAIVFQPSDAVRVDVPTEDLAAPHIIKHLKETFAKRYEAAGVKVADDAQFALMIDPGRMGIPKTSVWKVSLLQAGQTIWSAWVQGTRDGALLQTSEPAGVETRFADPPEIRAALAGVLQLDPPLYAFSRDAARGFGTSLLTTSGPRPQK